MSENQGTATNTATTLTLLQKCKNMLGVTDTEYEDEIQDLIDAAKADLGIAGVTKANVETDALVRRAIMTYVNMNWNISAGEYQNVLQSYETQKKQLMSATGYTDWLDGENDEPESEAAGGGEG
jgi:hypothetical protein